MVVVEASVSVIDVHLIVVVEVGVAVVEVFVLIKEYGVKYNLCVCSSKS